MAAAARKASASWGPAVSRQAEQGVAERGRGGLVVQLAVQIVDRGVRCARSACRRSRPGPSGKCRSVVRVGEAIAASTIGIAVVAAAVGQQVGRPKAESLRGSADDRAWPAVRKASTAQLVGSIQECVPSTQGQPIERAGRAPTRASAAARRPAVFNVQWTACSIAS